MRSIPTLLLATFTVVSLRLSAQEAPFSCSSSGLEHLAPFLAGHPERLQQVQQANAQLEQFTQQYTAAHQDDRGGNQYVIPIVFHIIHNNGPENISDDQIKDAVRILNLDYNKLNTDWEQVQSPFLPIVADIGITFRLAGLDPDGNCTSGITRTVSELTNDGGQDMKDLIDWPRDKYLNVWVAASAGGAAGYSQYPGNVAGPWGAGVDGVVILHNYVGSIGTSAVSHSRALTHEIGHFLNLMHCWGDSNQPGVDSNCGMDDNVSDTPNTIGWTSCNLHGATCGSTLDNVENYMEYSYCSKMFTSGQRTRMIAALNSNTASRNNLWSASNLSATGTADPQTLCAAAFSADQRVICAGGSVHFIDESYHGPTTWQWSFDGGDPATSSDEQPTVTYANPGIYAVHLTAGNGQSTVHSDVAGYVTVMPSTGSPWPYAENFDGLTSLDPTQWVINNPDGDAGAFTLRTDAGYSGTHSIRMKNNGIDAGHLDELSGSTIDLSGLSSVTFSFRYAFARRTSTNDDALRIYVSNTCGETWNLRKQIKGSTTLPTVPDQTASFTPTSPDQWQLAEITNISTSYLVSDFRFKFWFTGDGGNDLWIDDININGVPVGMEELSTTGASMQVVPNPINEEGTLVVDLASATRAQVDVLDPTGRVVRTIQSGELNAGAHRWPLSVAGLSSGAYLVRLRTEQGQQVQRFVKQ